MKLQGMTAIVVGTSPNIGSGIAEVLAREGAAVACVDADENNARDCAKAIRTDGGKAIGLRCNVCDESDVRKTVEAAIREFGPIDILVNGVASYNLKGVLTMPVEEFRHQIDVILTGAFLMTKHVGQAMIDAKRSGSIIHIGSTEAYQGNPQNVGYCTAKAGILSMARANAMEFASYGIRVNSITPTATDPAESFDRARRWGREMTDDRASTLSSPDLARRRMKLLPLGHGPSPYDYGRAAVFLASDDSKYITGLDIRVDAGAVSRYWGWTPTTLT